MEPIQVNLTEMEGIICRLSKNKATGLDGLPDNSIHDIAKIKDENNKLVGLEVLRERLNELLRKSLWPHYLSTAKFIALSKTESAFPKSDELRTIAILPAWTKVIESVILERLNKQLYGPNGKIHRSQVGFRPGCGTEIQINKLLILWDQIKEDLMGYRARKIKASERPKYFAIFIDLRKAYDRVDRDLLLAKMLDMEIEPQTIAVCSKLLLMSAVKSGDKTVFSKVGVPQGGCLSPSEFNIYINSLIVELDNDNIGVLAYADDIVIFTKGKARLTSTLRKIEEWRQLTNMEVNKNKSGIM